MKYILITITSIAILSFSIGLKQREETIKQKYNYPDEGSDLWCEMTCEMNGGCKGNCYH